MTGQPMTLEEAEAILGLPRDYGPYEVPRTDEVTESFFHFLHAVGLQWSGLTDPKARPHAFHSADATATIRTPRFVVRPYDWSDGGPDADLPNFEAFEEGLRIWWYKYPFRSATSTLPIEASAFAVILGRLLDSLPPDFPRRRPQPRVR